MRRLWWLVGLAAFLVFLYVTALPGDLPVGREAEGGLLGVYTVNGVDDTGAEYSGTMTIADVDASDGRYDVEWIITGAIQRGTGVVEGDRFVTDWEVVASADDTIAGRTVYELDADGAPVRGERTLVDAGGGGLPTPGVVGAATETVFSEQ